jgi:hypothetical protein
VRHPEQPGYHPERITGLFRGVEGSICRDPGGVGLVLVGKGRGGCLIGARPKTVKLRAIIGGRVSGRVLELGG